MSSEFRVPGSEWVRAERGGAENAEVRRAVSLICFLCAFSAFSAALRLNDAAGTQGRCA